MYMGSADTHSQPDAELTKALEKLVEKFGDAEVKGKLEQLGQVRKATHDAASNIATEKTTNTHPSPLLDQSFWDRHREWIHTMVTKNGRSIEKDREYIERVCILVDCRQFYANYGYEECGPIVFTAEEDNPEKRVFMLECDSFRFGTFKTIISIGPEIILDMRNSSDGWGEIVNNIIADLEDSGIHVPPIILTSDGAFTDLPKKPEPPDNPPLDELEAAVALPEPRFATLSKGTTVRITENGRERDLLFTGEKNTDSGIKYIFVDFFDDQIILELSKEEFESLIQRRLVKLFLPPTPIGRLIVQKKKRSHPIESAGLQHYGVV